MKLNTQLLLISFFKFFNKVYKNAFFFYKFSYFTYKRISDRNTIKHIKKVIKPGMVVLDIGAGVGFYSLLFSNLIGAKGKVIAFEPEEQNFKWLSKLTRQSDNIEICNLAVSDKSGSISLFISKSLNVDHQTYRSDEPRESISVNAVSIDGFLEEYHKDLKIDIIKIDIQGFDYHGFIGMKNTLMQSPDVIIFGEYYPYGMERAGVAFDLYYNSLIEMGFNVSFNPPFSIAKIALRKDDKYYYTDFVASRKSDLPDLSNSKL